MRDSKEFEEAVDFTAKYYEHGAFMPDLKFVNTVVFHNRRRIVYRWVAAAVGLVTISAAAMFISYHYKDADTQILEPAPVEVQLQTHVYSPERVVHLEFNDAPLTEVVSGVENAYNVKLINVPEEELHLTLSYEGNAEEFVDMINELLGTDIRVEK
ncbi:MAG: DUF4974 domain-containing protein [Muribaculaceae bacterium]|nr:DUF4974 domain-containing protein [Muribaculaceae bacterium]